MPQALLSVYDKTGIVSFAHQLVASGYSLIASGGTGKLLTKGDIDFVEVSDLTGFPEIMDGRVKTLHPKIHSGILARRDQDQNTLDTHQIEPIDIVVVNFYPFEKILKQYPNDYHRLVENIDIGGPTLIRAAAKNHRWVTVITDPKDYESIGLQIIENKDISYVQKQRFAARAFQMCADYDRMIHAWLSRECQDTANHKKKTLNLTASCSTSLRYGENPHQSAELYLFDGSNGWNSMKQSHGKPLSYNNIIDSETALLCVNDLKHSACVIVKHATPCGVACHDNLVTAYKKAFQCDPESAFGGIVAFNRHIDATLVKTIADNQFVEVILAPSIAGQANKYLENKPNVRLITLTLKNKHDRHIRSISGGLLIQRVDATKIPNHEHKAGPKPNDGQIDDLVNAWDIVKHIKSNAVLLYKNGQTLGIGAGQTSRIQALRISIAQAKVNGFDTEGSIMASDAFLPFADNVEYAAEHGISQIIQTGGSMRDQAVLDVADRLNVGMTFTGLRCFVH